MGQCTSTNSSLEHLDCAAAGDLEGLKHCIENSGLDINARDSVSDISLLQTQDDCIHYFSSSFFYSTVPLSPTRPV